MPFWDSWFTKSPQQPTAEGISLTEDQVKVLNEVFPEFDGSKTPDQLWEGITTRIGAKMLSERLQSKELQDYQVAAAYTAAFTRVSEVRYETIRQVEAVRLFYIVDAILNQVTEDALAPEVGTGEILTVSSENEEIQKELDLLDEKFDFDQIVRNITPDLLAIGEYTLKTKVNPTDNTVDGNEDPSDAESEDGGEEENSESATNEFQKVKNRRMRKGSSKYRLSEEDEKKYGLIDILDVVEQGSVISLSKDGMIEGYLTIDDKGKVIEAEPADYIKFSLDSQRVRVDVAQELGYHAQSRSGGTYHTNKSMPKLPDHVPRFVRVGKSLIFPVISKIKELQLLEALVPATKISKLTSGTVVGVNVPPGYEVEQGLKAAEKVEGVLNKKVGVDKNLGEINVENIMYAAGRMKVVPLFGDKGQLERMDFKSDEPEDLLASVDDIRRVILASVGIPFEIMFQSDEGNKGEVLKRYARYLRRLKNIQRALQDGIRQIVYIHLANKGVDFATEDVVVEFRNRLIEIDNLDRLEFMDTTVGMLKNLVDFFVELGDEGSPFENRIDNDSVISFVNEQLSVIGLESVIIEDPEDIPPEEEPGSTYQDRDPDNRPDPTEPVDYIPPELDNPGSHAPGFVGDSNNVKSEKVSSDS